jgi:glycosyltransferase involved in cell wall biosynthesis
MSFQNKKILIDATFINHGGGKELLNYLIDKFENTNLSMTYLLDHRIKNKHTMISESNNVFYTKNSLIKRHFFYFKNKRLFDKVLCFGNVPPTLRLNVPVYTYFHQLLYLENAFSDGFINGLIRNLKIKIIVSFAKNTDYWLVQTNNVKRLLLSRLNSLSNNVLCLPFFNIMKNDELDKTNNEINSFIYVSASEDKYKNHINLIDGFIIAHKKIRKIQLHLTINSPQHEIKSRLDFCMENNIPITNHGIVKKDELKRLYQNSNCVIFPSLVESFGLPIIEGINFGCKIIASDRKYVDAVCEPTMKFDPLNKFDIADKIVKFCTGKTKKSKLLVKDEINNILELFN